MKLIIKNLFLLVFLMLSTQSIAFDDTGVIESNEELLSEESLQQGAIFDRTITQTGLDFCREFSRLWSVERVASRYAITIRETPTARYGSIIWVEENNRRLHRVTVGHRSKNITEKAIASVSVVKKKLGTKQIVLN